MATLKSQRSTWYFLLVIFVVAIIDIPINAAAGAAAAATGAHVNGSGRPAGIIRLGALGGLIKSGILNFASLVCMTSANEKHYQYMTLLLSPFGMAIVVTLILSQEALGETDERLLIAALAAAAPLSAGSFMAGAVGVAGGIPQACWDALGGYTFARVAQNNGFHVCEYNASAAAGAVYGIVTFVAKLPVISARDQIIKEIAEDDV